MDNYIFNFLPTFNFTGNSTCSTPSAFTSHDYQNPLHMPFPPNSVQLALQLLTSPDPSHGYPALDPALLAISIHQLESSSTSRPTLLSPAVQVAVPVHDCTPCVTVEHPPNTSLLEPPLIGKSTPSSNITSTPGASAPNTCPDNGSPHACNDGISVANPAGNKSTWATRNPGWPVTQPCQPLSAVEKECHSAYAASRQILSAQQKDRDMLLNEAVKSLADEFEAKVQVIVTVHNIIHKKVKKLLGGHQYYQNPRSTQLANVIIHDKAHEVNEVTCVWEVSGVLDDKFPPLLLGLVTLNSSKLLKWEYQVDSGEEWGSECYSLPQGSKKYKKTLSVLSHHTSHMPVCKWLLGA
ncbi:hypothetical protein EDC04DRAFT_2986143 [Pisolithus marmoratus]|nr:hypothetical protein EDC04DRAFT_2986143 [Pisolithus marmoratus]